jgi:hypothetical protein
MSKGPKAEKPHANVDECLLLVQDKRGKARTAMHGMIAALVNDPYNIYIVPFILEYLTNMIYCIELMLKVLSGSWRSHDIATMYEKVFQGSQTRNLMTPLLQPFDQMCVAGNPGTGDSSRPEGGCVATRGWMCGNPCRCDVTVTPSRRLGVCLPPRVAPAPACRPVIVPAT